ncbi:MAG: hypothetical protein HY002_00380 [Candidatus Rokubacteria bacterium]|nr:hypothetical protein [Candidatus Rokubacteria bacterium]
MHETILARTMIAKRVGWIGPEDLRFGPGCRGFALPASAPDHDVARAAPVPPPRSHREVALELAAGHGAVTRGQLARASGISGEHARRTLGALARLGLLRRLGAGRGTRYVRP